jgi:hypothetical protein
MVRLSDFEELQEFVRHTLCARADMTADAPLIRRVLRRNGRPCGVEFTLVAPRSVRLSAIWESGENRVLFYDQNLERFQVSKISGLTPEDVPAAEGAPATASMWRGK